MRRALEARFPDLQVVGTNYPPGSCAVCTHGSFTLTCFLLAAPTKALLARAVSLASTSAIALTLGGDTVLPALGIRTPDFLKSMQASKLQTCAAAWFLGNTGALLVRSIFALCSRLCWRSASKPDQHRGV